MHVPCGPKKRSPSYMYQRLAIALFLCKFVSRSKDGVVLSSTEHIVIESVVSDGHYTLTIVSATMSDAGKYTVTASNQAGKCQCTATLVVQG